MPFRVCLLAAAVTLLSAPAQAGLWSLLNPEITRLEHERQALEAWLAHLPPQPPPQLLEHAGYHSGFTPTAASVRWVQVDLGAEMPIDQVVVIPAYFGVTSQGSGPYGWPARFRVDASRDAAFTEPVTLLDATRESQPATMAPLVLPGHGGRARYVRFTATELALQPRSSQGRYMFCLGELMVWSQGRNAALHAGVTGSSALETPPTWMKSHLVDGWSALGVPALPDPAPGNGWHSGISPRADSVKWVQVDLGESATLEELRLCPAHPPDFPDRPGFGFPRRYRVECSEHADFSQASIIADWSGQDFPNPGDNVVTLRATGLRGRHVRMTATELWQRNADYVFALAEMEVISGGRNLAFGKPVTFLDETNTGTWTAARLVDGMAAQGKIMEAPRWLQQLQQRTEAEASLSALSLKQAGALETAHRRAWWAGALLLTALLLLVLLVLLRGRRLRQREMEALRERIARDLHDEVGSHLGTISLASELALRNPGLDTETRGTLDELQRTARQAAESMRGILWLVREDGEPALSRLVQALRESASAQLHGVRWKLSVPEPSPDRTATLEFHRHVFLFFKEAVHNVVRHAEAAEVTIEAQWTAEHFDLTIADDGRGFDPASPHDGSGLSNLRHRARALQGRMELATMPGQGVRVTLHAPLRSPS